MAINLMFLMIPFVLTIYFYLNYGAETAIEKSVIPFMVMVPFTFNVIVSPLFPVLSFYSCTIFPMLVIGLIVYKIKMDFSLMDFFMVSYIVVTYYVGLESSGKIYAGYMLGLESIYSIIPYFVIRCFVDKKSVLRIMMALFIWISIPALFAPLEFFFNRGLAHIYQIFWRSNGLWAPFVRYGFYRVYSNFGHPIHAGIVFSVSILIGVMLYKMKVFKNKKTIVFMIMVNIMAMIMTLSRSSYITLVPVLMLFWYSVVKNKKSYMILSSSFMFLTISIVMPLYNSYLEIKPGEVLTETKSSAIYRKMLTDNYIEIAKEEYLIGYGEHIPVLDGQFSIDNEYLFIALKHGIIPMIIFGMMHLMVLIKAIFTTGRLSRRENMILWSLTAIVVYYSILNYSVWQTGTSKVILFMIFALAVNFTSTHKEEKNNRWNFIMK